MYGIKNMCLGKCQKYMCFVCFLSFFSVSFLLRKNICPGRLSIYFQLPCAEILMKSVHRVSSKSAFRMSSYTHKDAELWLTLRSNSKNQILKNKNRKIKLYVSFSNFPLRGLKFWIFRPQIRIPCKKLYIWPNFVKNHENPIKFKKHIDIFC